VVPPPVGCQIVDAKDLCIHYLASHPQTSFVRYNAGIISEARGPHGSGLPSSLQYRRAPRIIVVFDLLGGQGRNRMRRRPGELPAAVLSDRPSQQPVPRSRRLQSDEWSA